MVTETLGVLEHGTLPLHKKKENSQAGLFAYNSLVCCFLSHTLLLLFHSFQKNKVLP